MCKKLDWIRKDMPLNLVLWKLAFFFFFISNDAAASCICKFLSLMDEVYVLLVDKMQSDNGKLFIGGISWDTNEERLREYFSTYGEVVEAVIMKDRTTGRARGFGFVVFSDPAVAEIVIKEKHNIDGRMVISCHAPLS